MKKIFFTILGALTLFFSVSQAKIMYVVDSFKIMVRRQPGVEERRVSLPDLANQDSVCLKFSGVVG